MSYKYRTGEPVSMTPPLGVTQESWNRIIAHELARGAIVEVPMHSHIGGVCNRPDACDYKAGTFWVRP